MIDDEPEIGTLVQKVAEGLEYEMSFVTHGEAFKGKYRSLLPDVIILDLSMPETDGIELLAFLAEEKSRARVVILSGFDPAILIGAYRLGEDRGLDMAGIIAKPVRMAELRKFLDDLKAKQPNLSNK